MKYKIFLIAIGIFFFGSFSALAFNMVIDQTDGYYSLCGLGKTCESGTNTGVNWTDGVFVIPNPGSDFTLETVYTNLGRSSGTYGETDYYLRVIGWCGPSYGVVFATSTNSNTFANLGTSYETTWNFATSTIFDSGCDYALSPTDTAGTGRLIGYAHDGAGYATVGDFYNRYPFIRINGEMESAGSWNEDYNFEITTNTPGFFSNATNTEGWIEGIWNSTSSAFYIDCSGYSGGLFTSSTLGAIGCYAQKVPMGIIGMLLAPLPQSTNYFSASFAEIKNQFPFSIITGIQESIETAGTEANTVSTSTLDFPIFGHGTISVLGPNTLTDAIGAEMKDQIFTVIRYIIWIGVGLGALMLI